VGSCQDDEIGMWRNTRKVCRATGGLICMPPLRALALVGRASLLFRERLLAGPVEMGSLRNMLPCPRRLLPPKHQPPPPPDIPPSTTTALHDHISPFHSPAWPSDASQTFLVRLYPPLHHVEAITMSYCPKQPPTSPYSSVQPTATGILPVNSRPAVPVLLHFPS
jgi:hypothetical protein